MRNGIGGLPRKGAPSALSDVTWTEPKGHESNDPVLRAAARSLFRFGPLHAGDLALTLSEGIGVLIVL